MQVENTVPKEICKTPKVSVCVVTYNQEKYIRECLQSIVDQETDFDFEVIVGDDFSTDGTCEIVTEFSNRYPNLIKLILNEKNVGAAYNYKAVHDLAIGEYIAHCDGDDSWLPNKLQRQAEVLDKNPLASQCWTCARRIDDSGNYLGVFPSKLSRLLNPVVITPKHIALSYALVGQHSSHMYRRVFKPSFDPNSPILDYWIAFNLSLKGVSIYLKDVLSNYRLTASPSITRTESKKRATVDVLGLHLSSIMANHCEFAREAKSNAVARKTVSKIRGHDLNVINYVLDVNQNVNAPPYLIFKSMAFLLMQKFFR